MTQAEILKLKNLSEQVLHVRGNYRGGILEMAMVFDCGLKPEELSSLAADAAGALKSKGEIFRNVRLNAVRWQDDDTIISTASSMPFLQMGRFFEDYTVAPGVKTMEKLTANLKFYHARSKLILVFTDGAYRIADRKALADSLKPFLEKKLIFLTLRNGKLDISRKISSLTYINPQQQEGARLT